MHKMSLAKTRCNYLLRTLYNLNSKYYSVKSTSNDQLIFTPKFTYEEQQKILSIVNQSNGEQLSRYNVSASRIKHFEVYKNKRGPFQSLDDILEVEGLGIKALEKICQNIINNNVTTTCPEKTAVNTNGSKRLRNLISPVFPEEKLLSLSSVVGLHLGPTGISWAKLFKNDSKLEIWGFEDFSDLPPKLLPSDTFNLAMKILRKMPVGDVYVFEGVGKNMQSNQPNLGSQQLELVSMLLALINTSPKHNSTFQNGEIIKMSSLNVVYFLKPLLPARLFKTLVGNERVSTVETVKQILSTSDDEFTLPCSRITLDKSLVDDYNSRPSTNKELLGQALMLSIAFMDICVRKNPESLSALISVNGNGKK